MPELPEVEHFRSLLEPLISSKDPLHLERRSLDKKPPRKFLTDDDIKMLNQGKFYVTTIIRKGKQIAMELTSRGKIKYLFVHMGMTGRISTPDVVPELKEVKTCEYPPPHVYLKFTCGDNEACFSDPRKFGSILLADSLQEMDALAPDALRDFNESTKLSIIEKLSNQSMGIKALLLDQKRVVAGVGNWVADEVLYQTKLHPDQNFLTLGQATHLLDTLHQILSTAVECLVERKTNFPSDWLFHYRWNSKKTTNDSSGRIVIFITSGGRTSAIAPSIQQKKGQKALTTSSSERKRAKEDSEVDVLLDEKAKKSKKSSTKDIKNDPNSETETSQVVSSKKKAPTAKADRLVKIEKETVIKVEPKRRSTRLSSLGS